MSAKQPKLKATPIPWEEGGDGVIEFWAEGLGEGYRIFPHRTVSGAYNLSQGYGATPYKSIEDAKSAAQTSFQRTVDSISRFVEVEVGDQ